MAWVDDLFGAPQPVDAANTLAPDPGPWSWRPPEWDAIEQPASDPLAALTPNAPAEPITPPLGTPDPTLAAATPGPNPADATDPLAAGLQPGLPVPADTFESAMAGQDQADLGQLAEAKPDYMSPVDHVTAEPPDVEAMALEYANASPEQRVAIDANRAETERQTFAARQLEVATADREKLERDESARLQATEIAKREADEVAAEAKELANTEIDGGRWWSSRSAPQKIAGFLSAIVGGLVQGRRGGPNEGLAMIEREIDRDIDVQKANLANKRAALGDRRAANNDQFGRIQEDARSAAVHRVASWESVQKSLLAEQMNYDPAGTRAQRIGQAIVGARAAQAKAMQEFNASNFKNRLEMIKIDQDQQKIDETTRANRVKEQRAAASAAAGASSNVKQPPEYWKAVHGIDVPIAMSQKDLDKWLGTQKGISEIGKEGRAAAAADEKTRLEREVTLPNGEKFVANGTPETVDQLRNKVAATNTVVRLMDEARRIRTGWTSDSAMSDEWQELKGKWAAAQGVAKDVLGLGALSGPDMELVNRFIGTNDPTQMRDPSAGIKAARQNLINITSDALGSKGYADEKGKPKKFDIPDITGYDKPTASAGEIGFKKAQTGITLLSDLVEDEVANGIAQPVRGSASSADRFAKYVAPGDKITIENVVPPSAKKAIDTLHALALHGSEKEQADALVQLQQLTEIGGNAGIKKAARAAMFDAGQGPLNQSPSQPDTQVQYETTPPERE